MTAARATTRHTTTTPRCSPWWTPQETSSDRLRAGIATTAAACSTLWSIAREAAEELGLTDFRFRHLDTYVHESAVERELVYVYRCTYAGCPHPTAELDGGRFMPAGHIRRAADAHSLTPNFASEYARLFPLDIRRATEADIPTLRRLAEATFVPTYRPILTPEQLDYMMEWMYSADSLHQQMASGHAFYLAEDEDGPCGYVSIEQQAEGLFHLQKLYVHPSRQKRGYGQRLFMQAADYATALTDGPCRIELNVNRDLLHERLHHGARLGRRLAARRPSDALRQHPLNPASLPRERLTGLTVETATPVSLSSVFIFWHAFGCMLGGRAQKTGSHPETYKHYK